MKIRKIKLWTWVIKEPYKDEWELCYFFTKTKKELLSAGKPSPEARPVRVWVG